MENLRRRFIRNSREVLFLKAKKTWYASSQATLPLAKPARPISASFARISSANALNRLTFLGNKNSPQVAIKVDGVACQSGSRARMAQAGSAGPCLRQHLLSPTVYTSCIYTYHPLDALIYKYTHALCYTVKLAR